MSKKELIRQLKNPLENTARAALCPARSFASFVRLFVRLFVRSFARSFVPRRSFGSVACCKLLVAFHRRSFACWLVGWLVG